MEKEDTVAADIEIVIAPVHVDYWIRVLVVSIICPLIFLPSIITVLVEYCTKWEGHASEIRVDEELKDDVK
jgi:hypothetical protein